MLKIILVLIVLALLAGGLFYWYKMSNIKPQNPIIQTVSKVLGFSKDSKTDLINHTKDTLGENTQKGVDTVKNTIYNQAKTTLDNVFNKQPPSDKPEVISVNILGVTTNPDIDKQSYDFDFNQSSELKLNLTINKKYYLKFQNIPTNYCLHINDRKYPISEGIVEIQFSQSGNYPVKANSCDLDEKHVGTLSVQ